MARIKNNLTGDVFEAPARDFANEADFTIVDSSTPITAEAPEVPASDPGESDTPVSAPAEPASSGSIVTPDSTQSSDLASTQTEASPPSSEPSTSTPDGTAPSAQGDAGNAATPTATGAETATGDAGNVGADPAQPEGSAPAAQSDTTADATALGDSGNADTSVGVATDVNAAADAPNVDASTSPDGAATDASTPAPSPAPTLDVNSKHIVADQLESDALFAIAQLVTVNDSVKHAADAFFGQVHSLIDAEAAS